MFLNFPVGWMFVQHLYQHVPMNYLLLILFKVLTIYIIYTVNNVIDVINSKLVWEQVTPYTL